MICILLYVLFLYVNYVSFLVLKVKKNKNYVIKDYFFYVLCIWLKVLIFIISLLGSENYFLWLYF